MPEIIQKENEDGEMVDVEVFTAAELEAEKTRLAEEHAATLAEKEEHYKTKIDEFAQGKRKVGEKEKELTEKELAIQAEMEATRKMAEEAKSEAASEKTARLMAVRKVAFNQYGGSDPEVAKKLEEAWEVVNVELTDENSVVERAKIAARVAGFGEVEAPRPIYGANFSGGHAPEYKREEGLTEEKNNQFKQALGLDHLIPKDEN